MATLSVLGHNIATLSAACPPRYGDVVAVTRAERCVAILCMLFGSFTFGYIIGAVSGVVAMRDSRQNRFQIIMRDLNTFMNEGNFPQELRVKLRDYFKYKAEQVRFGAHSGV